MTIIIKSMETPEEIEGKSLVHWQTWREAYDDLLLAEFQETMTLERCRFFSQKYPENTLIAIDGLKVVVFISYGNFRGGTIQAGEIIALYFLKDYKVNKNDQEGPHISVKTYMAEDRYCIYSQEVETVDVNMAFGELWLDLSQASFASSQVAVHLDAKFGEVHIRLPHGCVMDTTGISHPLSSVKVDRFESDLEQVETRLHLSGSLFCTELEVEY